jgi:hypothetical protein
VAFGTLRKDSYFSPGEVLDEGNAFDEAVRLFGKALFDAGAPVDQSWFDAWDALANQWRFVWAQMNAWDGWIFRAKDSTRDELLELEAEYSRIKAGVAPKLEGDAGDALEDPTPESSRTPDNLTSAATGAAAAAGGVLQQVGWQLLVSAGIVVVGLVGLVYVARKGGVRLPGVMA